MNFNDPFEVNKKYIKEIISKTNDFLLNSRNYILSKNVKSFEKNFSKYQSSKYTVAVKNGTDALYISLKSLEITKGDEVILPILSATATLSAVIQSGAKPVFCDIDPIYFTIDEKKIYSLITKKTKAVIAVNLYGQSCDYSTIIPILKKKKIHLIEDCAQSLGSQFHNKKLGNFGRISAFSFFPTKNLGAIGDGGAVVTNDKSLYQKALKIRQYGWDKKRISVIDGINSRLDEIQAIILNIKIKHLEKSINLKKIIAEYYDKNLASLPIELPQIRNQTKHSYHLYVIKVKPFYRNKLIRYLEKKNIFVGIHYKNSLNNMPIAKKFLNNNNLESAKIVKQIISLPIYDSMTINQARLVVNYIKLFYKNV